MDEVKLEAQFDRVIRTLILGAVVASLDDDEAHQAFKDLEVERAVDGEPLSITFTTYQDRKFRVHVEVVE